MSSWTRIGSEWTRSPEILQLEGDVIVFYLSALCYCAEYATDGHVPLVALRTLWHRVSDPDDALADLHDVGLVEPTDTGVYFTRWGEHHLSSEDVAQRKAIRSARNQRYYAKTRATALERAGLNQTSDKTSDSDADQTSSDAIPTRHRPDTDTDPTRRGGAGSGEGIGGSDSGSSFGRPTSEPPGIGDGEQPARDPEVTKYLEIIDNAWERYSVGNRASAEDMRAALQGYPRRPMLEALKVAGLVCKEDWWYDELTVG